jgi:small conductance mechanosensitive channel
MFSITLRIAQSNQKTPLKWRSRMFVSDQTVNLIIIIGARIFAAITVLIIGRWLARMSRRLIGRALERTNLNRTIVLLTQNVIYYIVFTMTLMTALAILGVPVTSILAVASLIIIVIAIALQQSLGNLAATVNFMLFQPFSEGDLVETMGVLGIVKELQLLSTVIISPDNKMHVLPNAGLQNQGMTNYSRLGWVRREMAFQVSYSDQVPLALQVIRDVFSADSRIQQDPKPQVFVENLGDNGIEIAAWPFVEPSHYWAIQFDLVQQVKAAFDNAGITVPFPQRDLHLRSGALSTTTDTTQLPPSK